MSKFTEAFESGSDWAEFLSPGTCSNCMECFDGYVGGPADFVQDVEMNDYSADNEFSWSQCDICGSTLGGSRHAAHAFDNGELVHLMVCVDCVMYMANGDKPEEWRRS